MDTPINTPHDKIISLALTYFDVMAIVRALDYRATRLDDLAEMTSSRDKRTAMREEASELLLLAGQLMEMSKTDAQATGHNAEGTR